MKIYSYLEENTKHIIFTPGNQSSLKEDFLDALQSYWKKLRITLIDTNLIDDWLVVILKSLQDKNSEDTLKINVTSYNLSLYFNQLQLTHKYLSPYKFELPAKDNNVILDSSEIDKFLQDVYIDLNKDFRNYEKSVVEKIITGNILQNKLKSFEEYRRIFFDSVDYRNNFIDSMSVTFSSFFRNPSFYAFLRNDVLKKMKNFYSFNLWSAGCSSGMEAFSLAIILYEEGLLNKASIYATDFNENILQIGKNGIYSKKILPEIQKNYKKSGGENSIWDYFEDKGTYIQIKPFIKNKINFFNHDLTNDSVFKEFDIIICRNVFIYFNDELKNKVLNLFYESMKDSGYLGLGSCENVHYYNFTDKFIQYKKGYNIYRKSITGILEVGTIE